jgi:hypothetical protein
VNTGSERLGRARSRIVAALVVAGLVLVPAGCSSPKGEAKPSPAPAPGTTSDANCTIAAAGDVAGEDDFQDGAARTADLITGHRPQAVVVVGDSAYDEGTAEQYADYYDPTWGAFKDITLPVAGNHEYETSGAAGFAEYFGQEVLSNRTVDMCGWRLVLVNQYAGIDEAASFIAQQAGTLPLVVAWHEPRFSSGDEHGSEPDMQPLWEASATAGALIVLNGHDHDYERFAPLDAEGNPVPDGTREFVIGLGGHHIRDFADIEANSEARFTGTPAVLFLTLGHKSYAWEERAVDGTVVDSGTTPLPSPSS